MAMKGLPTHYDNCKLAMANTLTAYEEIRYAALALFRLSYDV